MIDGPDAASGMESGLLRQDRTDGFWGRARRRHPVAVPAVLVAPAAVFFGLGWLLDRYVPGGGGAMPFVAAVFLFLPLRRRAVATADAEDEADGVGADRTPVDVRTAPPARPSFGPGTLTGEAVAATRWAWPFLLGMCGLMLAGSEVVRSWPHPSPVPIVIGLVIALAGLVVGQVSASVVGRRTRAFLDRDDLEPVPVRVVGLRADDRFWVLEPLDGRPRLFCRLYSDDELLGAGDVVHVWGDVSMPDVPFHLAADDPRVALTGPFGTLWTRSVRYDALVAPVVGA